METDEKKIALQIEMAEVKYNDEEEPNGGYTTLKVKTNDNTTGETNQNENRIWVESAKNKEIHRECIIIDENETQYKIHFISYNKKHDMWINKKHDRIQTKRPRGNKLIKGDNLSCYNEESKSWLEVQVMDVNSDQNTVQVEFIEWIGEHKLKSIWLPMDDKKLSIKHIISTDAKQEEKEEEEFKFSMSSVKNIKINDNQETDINDKINYAFSTFTHKKYHLSKKYKKKMTNILKEDKKFNYNTSTIKHFTKSMISKCDANEDLTQATNKIYNSLQQYDEYMELVNKLKDDDNNHGCCSCSRCYKTDDYFVQISERNILKGEMILTGKCTDYKVGITRFTPNAHTPNVPTPNINVPTPIEEKETFEITSTASMTIQKSDEVTIKVLEQKGGIELSVGNAELEIQIQKGDILAGIIIDGDSRTVEGIPTQDVVKLLKLMPLETILKFRKQEHKCKPLETILKCKCCKKSKKKSKKKGKKKKESHESISITKVVNRIIKFAKLSLVMISAGSEMLNAGTDALLLYKAQANDALMFTMILSVSLLSPYVLSYSSGVQIFLYRKTFEKVQLFTFKSLLLGLYLFPTGILYFMFLDLIDVFLQLYVWFSYGVLGKIKSESELAQVESNVAEYFGMSRMDWFSFKKQKIMATLFFEAVPQVALQSLLFFGIIKGRELTGITNKDLLISIFAAVFSSVMQLFRLRSESLAVKETFVHYALNCITARFGWVAYKEKMRQFNEQFNEQVNQLQTQYSTLNDLDGYKKNKKCGCFGGKKEDARKLILDYNLKYPLPFITSLTTTLSERSKLQLLQVGIKHKITEATHGSVGYDFSAKTANTLISTIKALDSLENCTMRIIFGQSLRLLGVRPIVSIMQACSMRNIELPDIHKIDWHQAFKIKSDSDKDPRLFSHTFDEHDRTLLISLYLTKYAEDNHFILKSFVRNFDVEVNAQDNSGNTILHHMVRKADYDSINILLNSLKPKQRIHFDIQNDDGNSIIHEMIKQKAVTTPLDRVRSTTVKRIDGDSIDIIGIDDYEELKDLLQLINSTLKTGQKFNITSFNRVGETIMYLALERDRRKLLRLNGDLHNDYKLKFEREIIAKSKITEQEKRQMQKDIDSIVHGVVEYEDVDEEIEPPTIHNIMHFANEIKKSNLINKKDTMTASMNKQIASLQTIKNENKRQNILKELTTKLSLIDDINEEILKLKDAENKQNNEPLDEKLDEENKFNEQDDDDDRFKFTKLTDEDENINMMHRLLLDQENYPEIVNSKIHLENTLTSFGYILQHFSDYCYYFEDLINFFLLETEAIFNDASLLYPLFVTIIHNNQKKSNMNSHHAYFQVFQDIIKQYNLSLDKICDKNGNNPIHFLMDPKESNFEILSNLCEQYPQWMNMQNNEGHIPLYLTIINHDIDSFFCLIRYMNENRMGVRKALKQRKFVDKMIYFGFGLLKGERVTVLRLLLTVFKYDEIFYWKDKDHDVFNTDVESKDISLIKWVSETLYNDSIENVLFKLCNVENDKLEKEQAKHDNDDVDIKDENEDKNEDENQDENQDDIQDDNKYDSKDDSKDESEDDNKPENEAENKDANEDGSKDELDAPKEVDWVEIVYASVVEAFSAMDLVTDVIVLIELFAGDHMWWSTFMLLLLLAPYLVSHGSLVTLLQKKIDFYKIGTCWSFILFFLSTPISLFYLFMVDMAFMLFSVTSTIWFFIVFTVLLFPCGDRKNISKYDVRGWIDETVFEKWLNMNKTEIIGYRRLRTLSQLFFETMPQIILQIRMLWDRSINTQTLIISIGLAVVHLALEAGIIYLDSNAFHISFMEYSMICLGGRIQWIPFQHEIEDIVKNQFLMQHEDHNIDVDTYKITINDDKDNEDIILDYEDIRFLRYHLTYQFASQSIQRLTEMLTNSSTMIILADFKISSTNVLLQNFMKYIYCRAKIKLGRGSCGHIDLFELCQLNQACTNKMRIVIKDSQETMDKLVENTMPKMEKKRIKRKKSIGGVEIGEIEKLLIDFGFIQTESLKWIFNQNEDKMKKIKLKILDRCLPSNVSDPLRLDLLRNCFQNKRFVGTSCEGMKQIKHVIEEYFSEPECRRDNALYFVIIFILLYSKGNIFGTCDKGCHILDKRLKYLLKTYIPYIKLIKKVSDDTADDADIESQSSFKIPFELFESCSIFSDLRDRVEDVIINKCKNFILDSKKERKRIMEIETKNLHESIKTCEQWNYLKQCENADERIQNLLDYFLDENSEDKNEVNEDNVALLDEMIFKYKYYQPNNQYLIETLQFRTKQKKTQTVDCENLNYEKKSEYKYSIEMNEAMLLPADIKNKRYQIYEIECKWTEKEISRITLGKKKNEVDDQKDPANIEKVTVDDAKNQHNIFYEDEKQVPKKYIRVDKNNIGLARYNYDLLHYNTSGLFPNIKIESSGKLESMNVKYVQLYTEDDQKKLEEARAKRLEDEKQRKINEETEKKKKKRNVDKLLKTLKSQEQEIDDTEHFYDNILRLNFDEEWIPIIKNHHGLFQPLDHNPKKTIFHRLIDELQIDELQNIREYLLLTSTFQYDKNYEKFGYHSFRLDYSKNPRLFKHCQYEIIPKQENKENEEEQKTNTMQLKFDDIFWVPASNDIKTYEVYMSNARIFGSGRLFLQEMQTETFDHDNVQKDRSELSVIYSPDRFYSQLLDKKTPQNDINAMRRTLAEEKYNFESVVNDLALSNDEIKMKEPSKDLQKKMGERIAKYKSIADCKNNNNNTDEIVYNYFVQKQMGERIAKYESIADCDKNEIVYVVHKLINSFKYKTLNSNENKIINNIFRKYKITGYQLLQMSKEFFQDLLVTEVFNSNDDVKYIKASETLYKRIMNYKSNKSQTTLSAKKKEKPEEKKEEKEDGKNKRKNAFKETNRSFEIAKIVKALPEHVRETWITSIKKKQHAALSMQSNFRKYRQIIEIKKIQEARKKVDEEKAEINAEHKQQLEMEKQKYDADMTFIKGLYDDEEKEVNSINSKNIQARSEFDAEQAEAKKQQNDENKTADDAYANEKGKIIQYVNDSEKSISEQFTISESAFIKAKTEFNAERTEAKQQQNDENKATSDEYKNEETHIIQTTKDTIEGVEAAQIEYTKYVKTALAEYTKTSKSISKKFKTEKSTIIQIAKDSKKSISTQLETSERAFSQAQNEFDTENAEATRQQKYENKTSTEQYENEKAGIIKAVKDRVGGDKSATIQYKKYVKAKWTRYQNQLDLIKSENNAFKLQIEEISNEKIVETEKDAEDFAKSMEAQQKVLHDELKSAQSDYTRQIQVVKKEHDSWLELISEITSLPNVSKYNKDQIQFAILHDMKLDDLVMYAEQIERLCQNNNIDGTSLMLHFTQQYLGGLLSQQLSEGKEKSEYISKKIYEFKLKKSQPSIKDEQNTFIAKIASYMFISSCNEMEILFILNHEILNTFRNNKNKEKINQFFVEKKLDGNKLKSITKKKFQTVLLKNVFNSKKEFNEKVGKLYENVIKFKYKSNKQQKSIDEERKDKIASEQKSMQDSISLFDSIAKCDEKQILFIVNNSINQLKEHALDSNKNKLTENVFQKYRLTGDKLAKFSKTDFQELVIREVFTGNGNYASKSMSDKLYDALTTFKTNQNQQQKSLVEENKIERKKKDGIVEMVNNNEWIIGADSLKEFPGYSWGRVAHSEEETFKDYNGSRIFAGKIDKSGMNDCQLALTVNFRDRKFQKRTVKNVLFDVKCSQLNISKMNKPPSDKNNPVISVFKVDDISELPQLKWTIKSKIKIKLTPKQTTERNTKVQRTYQIDKLSYYSKCNKDQIGFIFTEFVSRSLDISEKHETKIFQFIRNKNISGQKLKVLELNTMKSNSALSGINKSLLGAVYYALRKYKYHHYQISIKDEMSMGKNNASDNNNEEDEKDDEKQQTSPKNKALDKNNDEHEDGKDDEKQPINNNSIWIKRDHIKIDNWNKWGPKLQVQNSSVSTTNKKQHSAFGELVCKGNKMKIQWDVTITKGDDICVGVCNYNNKKLLSQPFVKDANGYGYRGSDGKRYQNGKSKGYGSKFKNGDKVSIVLDMSVNELSFVLNGNHQGVAYILPPGEYRMGVCLLGKNQKITLDQTIVWDNNNGLSKFLETYKLSQFSVVINKKYPNGLEGLKLIQSEKECSTIFKNDIKNYSDRQNLWKAIRSLRGGKYKP